MVSRRTFLHVTMCVFLVAGAAAQGTQPDGAWSPDAVVLLQRIRAGDSQRASSLAATQLRSEHNPAVRRDLQAIVAIADLYQPDRTSRTDGQSLLYNVFREDPSMATRGECRLALGVATAALFNTSAALEHFAVAIDDFERRGAADQFADALEGLANVWVQHAEWETTPPRFGVRPPSGPDQTRAIRRQQIETLRQRATRFPLSDAADRIDLVLARLSLDDETHRPAAETAIENLCAKHQRDRVAVSAALILADEYEKNGRRDDLVRVLNIAAAGDDANRAELARQRLKALNEPAIEFVSPLDGATDAAPTLAIRARNLTRITAELRQIDLGGWLQEKQGRFLQAQLPTSGSVVWTRQWETATAVRGDWWNAPADSTAARLPADAGNYVLEVRGESVQGSPLVQRRLVTINNLRAAAFMGESRAALWVVPRGAGVAPTKLSGRFWMFGSFQPTKFELTNGVGTFTLPAEARLLRDRRWAIVIEGDGGPLFLQGALPAQADQANPGGTYLLTGATTSPAQPDRYTFTGAIVDAPGSNAPVAVNEPYSIVLLDTAGDFVADAPIQKSDSNLFSAEIAVDDAALRRRLSAVVRRGERSLSNIAGRFNLPNAPDDWTDAQLDVSLKNPATAGEQDKIPLRVQAHYPWNDEINGALANLGAKIVALPTADMPAWGEIRESSERTSLDANGRTEIDVPRFHDGPFDRPTLLGAWAAIRGWDGRRTSSFRQYLLGPQPSHAWITTEPSLCAAGEAINFAAGWIPPADSTCDAWPHIRVSRDDETLADLLLRADPRGIRTEEWRPAQSGEYRATLIWPAMSAGAACPGAELRFHVDAQQNSAEERTHAGQYFASIQLRDNKPVAELAYPASLDGAPLAALLLGSHDPIEVRPLGSDTARIAAPLTGAIPSHVVFARWTGNRVAQAAETRIVSRIAGTLGLTIESAPARVKPGDVAHVKASVTTPPRAGRASVVARLVAVSSDSTANWIGGEWRSDEIRDQSITVAVSTLSGDAAADARDWAAERAARTTEELFFADGQTLWTCVRDVRDGGAEFEIPIPQTPGGYRVLLMASAENAVSALAETTVIARDGFVLRAFAPENYSLGDRVRVVIQALPADPNSPASGAPLDVAFDGGGLLAIDAPAAASRPSANDAALTQLTIRIGDGQKNTAILMAEAIAAGDGVIRIRCPGGEANPIQIPLHVSTAKPLQNAKPALRIERTVIKLIPMQGETLPQSDPMSESRLLAKDWQRSLVDPDKERFAPGQVLLIREEFDLRFDIADLVWRQPIAPNCVTILERPAKTPEVAPIRARNPQAFEFAGNAITGRATHEYFIVTTRAGSCTLPPPTVSADGAPLEVEMAPHETRITVLGNE